MKAAKSGFLKKIAGFLVGCLVLLIIGFLALGLFLSQSFTQLSEDQERDDPTYAATEIPEDLIETLRDAAKTCSRFNDAGFLAAYINQATRWERDFETSTTRGIAALTIEQWEQYGVHDEADKPALVPDLRDDPHASIYALANMVCENAKALGEGKPEMEEGHLTAWMAYAMFASMPTVLSAEQWPALPNDIVSESIAMILSLRNIYACRLNPDDCIASATCADLPMGEPYSKLGVSYYGGFHNGQIPSNVLTPISFNSAHLVHPCAETQLALLNEAYRAEFGRDIAITDSYRSYTAQVATKASKGDLAATPGTSNHGWGLALDLVVGGYGSRVYSWLMVNGPLYGWHNPSWAIQNSSSNYAKPEPWHWEFFNDAVIKPVEIPVTPTPSQPSGPRPV